MSYSKGAETLAGLRSFPPRLENFAKKIIANFIFLTLISAHLSGWGKMIYWVGNFGQCKFNLLGG